MLQKFNHLLHRTKKIEFIEQFSEKLLVKQARHGSKFRHWHGMCMACGQGTTRHVRGMCIGMCIGMVHSSMCIALCALPYVLCALPYVPYAQEGEDLQIVDVHSSSIIHVPQTKFNPSPNPDPDPNPDPTLSRSRRPHLLLTVTGA